MDDRIPNGGDGCEGDGEANNAVISTGESMILSDERITSQLNENGNENDPNSLMFTDNYDAASAAVAALRLPQTSDSSLSGYQSYNTGTIDAEMVQEINDDVDETFELSPGAGCAISLPPAQTAGDERVAAAAAQLMHHPVGIAVPEVNVEEVNVDQSRLSVSGLTTSMWGTGSSLQGNSAAGADDDAGAARYADADHEEYDHDDHDHHAEMEDTKLPASPLKSAPAPPPRMPSRREFSSDESKKISYGTGTNTSSSGEFPDFKAQVNSRSFAVVAEAEAEAAQHGETSDSTSVVATAEVAQHEYRFDDGTGNTSNNDYYNSNDNLPEYKRQSSQRGYHSSALVSSPPPMPSGSPISSRQVSNNTSAGNSGNNNSGNNSGGGASGSRHNDRDTEHIPVVDAVLVPAERLGDEVSHQLPLNNTTTNGSHTGASPEQRREESGASTLTTTENSGNDGQQSRSKSSSDNGTGATPPPASERQFWITVIAVALLLNSLLVGGAVVGGFCAAGKCSSSTSTTGGSAAVKEDVAISLPSAAPSPLDRRLSATPSETPTVVNPFVPEGIGILVTQPTVSPAPVIVEAIPAVPPPPPPMGVPSFSPYPTALATLAPPFSAARLPGAPTLRPTKPPLRVEGGVPVASPLATFPPVDIQFYPPVPSPVEPPSLVKRPMGGGRRPINPTISLRPSVSPYPTWAPSITPMPSISQRPSPPPSTLSPTVSMHPSVHYTPYPSVFWTAPPSISKLPSFPPITMMPTTTKFPSFPPVTMMPTTTLYPIAPAVIASEPEMGDVVPGPVPPIPPSTPYPTPSQTFLQSDNVFVVTLAPSASASTGGDQMHMDTPEGGGGGTGGTGEATTGSVAKMDTSDVPSLVPSTLPSFSPIAVIKPTLAPVLSEKEGFPLLILVPILIGAEAVILVGLFVYYRRWKHQRKVYEANAIAAVNNSGTEPVSKSVDSWDEESELCI